MPEPALSPELLKAFYDLKNEVGIFLNTIGADGKHLNYGGSSTFLRNRLSALLMVERGNLTGSGTVPKFVPDPNYEQPVIKQEALLTNHEEASQLARIKQYESNLARCYIEARSALAYAGVTLPDRNREERQ